MCVIIRFLQVRKLEDWRGRANCQEVPSRPGDGVTGSKLGSLAPEATFWPPHHAASCQDDKLTGNCTTVPMEKIALPGQRITDRHKMLVLEVTLRGILPSPFILQMNK